VPSPEKRESNLRIRPMEPEDIDAVLAIDKKISGVRRAVSYTDLITGDLGGVLDLSFVAEVNGQIVGLILARRAYVGEPVVEVGLIQILGVDPDYQKQGIATKLVESLLETSRAEKLKAIRIMVKENDSQLQAFFARMGFRRGHLIDYTKEL
jgi:ribosomal protein S18 acetylase RimI-like enzyme